MATDLPKHFELLTGYAQFRPVAHLSFREALDRICGALTVARTRRVSRLFLDLTELTGFPSPSTVERYAFGEAVAAAAQGAVKVAVLARPEHLDPERFALLVARNRGLDTNAFTDRGAALAWLLHDTGDPPQETPFPSPIASGDTATGPPSYQRKKR